MVVICFVTYTCKFANLLLLVFACLVVVCCRVYSYGCVLLYRFTCLCGLLLLPLWVYLWLWLALMGCYSDV